MNLEEALVEIVDTLEMSRRTCYRYKSYYDNLMKSL